MNNLKKIVAVLFITIAAASLTGCAAGSATAGYALRADTADKLSSAGEQRVVDRAKKEIFAELYQSQNQNQTPTP